MGCGSYPPGVSGINHIDNGFRELYLVALDVDVAGRVRAVVELEAVARL
jgi:hypothetical protein